jgi:hypothetical protein
VFPALVGTLAWAAEAALAVAMLRPAKLEKNLVSMLETHFRMPNPEKGRLILREEGSRRG